MKITDLFVKRPVLAIVVNLVILIGEIGRASWRERVYSDV